MTKKQIEEIVGTYPTPFHIYDERGIRENAKALREAFAWNKGYKEFFAVKATPNPFLINILREYGCGCDCSSYTELMLCDAMGLEGKDIMFSSNDTPAAEFELAAKRMSLSMPRSWVPPSIWMILHISLFWRRYLAGCRRL